MEEGEGREFSHCSREFMSEIIGTCHLEHKRILQSDGRASWEFLERALHLVKLAVDVVCILYF